MLHVPLYLPRGSYCENTVAGLRVSRSWLWVWGAIHRAGLMFLITATKLENVNRRDELPPKTRANTQKLQVQLHQL